MKQITIFQENSEKLILSDDDNTSLEEYNLKVSKILESSKICILETSTQTVCLKPSKINSILVEEIKEKVKKDVIKDLSKW